MSDGLYVALRILEALFATNNYDMQTFTRIPQILVNVPVIKKLDLKSPPLHDMITKATSALPEGRLVARYSGTEPLLRIMAENPDFEHAQGVVHMLAEDIKKMIS